MTVLLDPQSGLPAKEAPDIIAGIMEGIQKMGGKPKMFSNRVWLSKKRCTSRSLHLFVHYQWIATWLDFIRPRQVKFASMVRRLFKSVRDRAHKETSGL